MAPSTPAGTRAQGTRLARGHRRRISRHRLGRDPHGQPGRAVGGRDAGDGAAPDRPAEGLDPVPHPLGGAVAVRAAGHRQHQVAAVPAQDELDRRREVADALGEAEVGGRLHPAGEACLRGAVVDDQRAASPPGQVRGQRGSETGSGELGGVDAAGHLPQRLEAGHRRVDEPGQRCPPGRPVSSSASARSCAGSVTRWATTSSRTTVDSRARSSSRASIRRRRDRSSSAP